MLKYALKPAKEKSVRAYGRSLRVSKKNSVEVCKNVNGRPFDKAMSFLQSVLAKRESIGGKYYTNAVREMVGLMESARKNAEFRGMEAEKMIVHASAHTGFRFFRPRRFKLRAQRRKVANIQLVLLKK